MSLQTLAPDLQELIFSFLPPQDHPRIPAVCRSLGLQYTDPHWTTLASRYFSADTFDDNNPDVVPRQQFWRGLRKVASLRTADFVVKSECEYEVSQIQSFGGSTVVHISGNSYLLERQIFHSAISFSFRHVDSGEVSFCWDVPILELFPDFQATSKRTHCCLTIKDSIAMVVFYHVTGQVRKALCWSFTDLTDFLSGFEGATHWTPPVEASRLVRFQAPYIALDGQEFAVWDLSTDRLLYREEHSQVSVRSVAWDEKHMAISYRKRNTIRIVSMLDTSAPLAYSEITSDYPLVGNYLACIQRNSDDSPLLFASTGSWTCVRICVNSGKQVTLELPQPSSSLATGRVNHHPQMLNPSGHLGPFLAWSNGWEVYWFDVSELSPVAFNLQTPEEGDDGTALCEVTAGSEGPVLIWTDFTKNSRLIRSLSARACSHKHFCSRKLPPPRSRLLQPAVDVRDSTKQVCAAFRETVCMCGHLCCNDH